jgi:hypothetical protein
MAEKRTLGKGRKMWKYRTSPRKPPNGMLFSTGYLYKRLYNQKKLEYKARTGEASFLIADFMRVKHPVYSDY